MLLTKQIPEESSLYVFSLLPVCCGKQNRRLTGQVFLNEIQITQKKIIISNAFSVKKKSTSRLFSFTNAFSAIITYFSSQNWNISATQDLLSVLRAIKCQLISSLFAIFVL